MILLKWFDFYGLEGIIWFEVIQQNNLILFCIFKRTGDWQTLRTLLSTRCCHFEEHWLCSSQTLPFRTYFGLHAITPKCQLLSFSFCLIEPLYMKRNLMAPLIICLIKVASNLTYWQQLLSFQIHSNILNWMCHFWFMLYYVSIVYYKSYAHIIFKSLYAFIIYV